MKARFAVLFLFVLFLASSSVACIKANDGAREIRTSDALRILLDADSSCPQNVIELRSLIAKYGFVSAPHMVANRGFHNPKLGSFSFFEQVTGVNSGLKLRLEVGQFFFGHFTGKQGSTLVLDQVPERGKLMIELIVWDQAKGFFNFYELIGTGTGGTWFYRGDSADILSDNQLLHLSSPPVFGKRLRCSGCHTSGGPIMKEIAFPHNDWWTQARPLPFGSNQPSQELKPWLTELRDASEFALSVRKGIARLESSRGYQALKARQSLQQNLRPLFCEVEINLESDVRPLGSAQAIQIPSASIASPFFGSGPLLVASGAYQRLVASKRLQFPETMRSDADHAWLAPVKGYSDLSAIKSLIQNRVVDSEFVADVLAIDHETPVFSSKRCQLLKLVPQRATAGWVEMFASRLKASGDASATELARNLEDEARDLKFHREQARQAFGKVRLKLASPAGQGVAFQELLLKRENVFRSAISQNPLGQIMEPGFRVIFPTQK